MEIWTMTYFSRFFERARMQGQCGLCIKDHMLNIQGIKLIIHQPLSRDFVPFVEHGLSNEVLQESKCLVMR